jgi:endonuclease/exonuclease/phosphatase family metal-dependent hydrolase
MARLYTPWYDKLLWYLNIFFALLLAASYTAPYIKASSATLPAFMGLLFPYLAITNMLLVAFWLVRLKNRFLLSLVLLVAGYGHLSRIVQFNSRNEYPASEAIRVLSVNVKSLGLNGPEFQTRDAAKVFDFLREGVYDVYCFQEFFHTDRKDFSPLDSFLALTATEYDHIEFPVLFRNNKFGIATFSRYPIVDQGLVDIETRGTNLCIYTDLKIGNRTVRVYNVHLESLHFSKEEMEFLTGENDEWSLKEIEKAEGVIARMSSAFHNRAEQSDILRAHMLNCPYPMIVCGDFNATPVSHTYHSIANGMKDAFKERGNGFGFTFNGPIPMLRIDYILYSEPLQLEFFQIIDTDISDHHPQEAYFIVPERDNYNE